MNIVLTLLDAGDRAVLFKPYYFNHLMALQVPRMRCWRPGSGRCTGGVARQWSEATTGDGCSQCLVSTAMSSQGRTRLWRISAFTCFD